MSPNLNEISKRTAESYYRKKQEVSENLIRCCAPFEMADVDLLHYLKDRVDWIIEPMSDLGREFSHLRVDGKHVASVVGLLTATIHSIDVHVYDDHIDDRFKEIYPRPEIKNPNDPY